MSGLRITISSQLADALIELFSRSVEAMTEELDETIDDDFSKFCASVRTAKRRARRKRILERARQTAVSQEDDE